MERSSLPARLCVAGVIAMALVAVVPLASGAAPSLHAKHKGGSHHHQDGGTELPIGKKKAARGNKDLSLKWLFMALGIAALIGAAGGEILVDLMGDPRRTPPPSSA